MWCGESLPFAAKATRLGILLRQDANTSLKLMQIFTEQGGRYNGTHSSQYNKSRDSLSLNKVWKQFSRSVKCHVHIWTRCATKRQHWITQSTYNPGLFVLFGAVCQSRVTLLLKTSITWTRGSQFVDRDLLVDRNASVGQSHGMQLLFHSPHGMTCCNLS